MSFQTEDQIHYSMNSWGNLDWKPFVALHGFTGNGLSLSYILPYSARGRNKRRIIAPDLLGHGMTDAPDNPERYRIEHAAADIVALIESQTSGYVDLYGYSMGGRLALYIALTYPSRIRSLILESASPGIADENERAVRRQSDETLANSIERDGIEAFVEKWERQPLFASQHEKTRQRLRPVRLAQRPNGLANSLRGMGTGVQPSLWDRLGELKMPVMLITGEKDAKFTAIATQMSVQIPNVRHLILKAGHMTHVDDAVTCKRIVGAFLRRD